MRFILFGAFYFSCGMAVAQQSNYDGAGIWTAVAAVLALMFFMHMLLGVFGGKVS